MGAPRKENSKVDFDPWREGSHVNTTLSPTTSNQLTLTGVELEANLAGNSSKPAKGGSYMAVIACKTHVVKKGEHEVGRREPGTGGLQGWVEGYKEKRRGPSGSPCCTPASEDKQVSAKQRRLCRS